MVFMNARKKNKTIIMLLVGAISIGLLMSVSVYFMGDYSGNTNAASNVAPGSVESKAVQDFQQAMALLQQNKADEAQKKFVAAKAGFEEVLKKDPNNVQTLGDLATTYFYMNNVDKAIETVKKALEVNPNFTTASLNYAVYLAYGKNNTVEAIKELEKIKKGDFNYDKAQQMIGEISKLSSQPPILPKGNNASAPTDQNPSSAPAEPDAAQEPAVDPFTGQPNTVEEQPKVDPFTGLEEGSGLPSSHPNIN